MQPAIRVENLSKLYRLGTGGKSDYATLQESLWGAVTAPWRRFRQGWNGANGGDEASKLWALKDVGFEVKPGELIGIIGSNGAGKSTLLKVLSQITEPTQGRVELRGRVGSLLEVGTGFHTELTGRENIYLNGAILGMSRTEITRKFDEIVAFSGVERFLDTPVKRYSSGMYVRLAFAVAAHLEPEILLVDEVLAVGDVEFQKKCLGKMKDVGQQGRTVLFVSHSIATLQALCQRGIFMHQGQVRVDDTIDRSIKAYLQTLEQNATCNIAERTDRQGRGQVRLEKIEMFVPGDVPSATLMTGMPVQFEFHVSEVRPGLSCVFHIFDDRGITIASFNSSIHGYEDEQKPEIGPRLICAMPELLLPPGRYRMNVEIRTNQETQDHLAAAAFFDVVGGPLRGRAFRFEGPRFVVLPHAWTTPY
jgi:lipopolysaccharide transport system ATP-binding protein